jgi:cysteine desulfurase
MLPYFTEKYGNAASVHAFGREAQEAVDRARHEIGSALGADKREIVFTSGATESNNLAIRGLAERARRRGNHIVSVRTEHRSVLDPLERLGRRGYELTLVDVIPAGQPRAGLVRPEDVERAIRPETFLVSVMLANNEIGAIQPVAEIGDVCRRHGVVLHCDATQAVGKIPVDVGRLNVDLMSFTAHKIYGPKGIGALFVRRTPPPIRLEPLIAGGGHERGLRSGTLPVPSIVGFARALKLCVDQLDEESTRLRAFRDRLGKGLFKSIEGVVLCGPSLEIPGIRLPANLTVSFGNVDGEALLMGLAELAVSSGAACSSTDPSPSHVLTALGLSEELVRSSLRFGLGRFNTDEEVDRAVDLVQSAVERLRRLAV